MSTKENERMPKFTRRSALGKGFAVAAGSALAMSAVSATADGMTLRTANGSIAYLLPGDEWENLIDTVFTVNGFSLDGQAGNSRKRLTLVETEVVSMGSRDVARPKKFRSYAVSLLFRGSGKSVLPEASYRVNHAWLGEFDLFLVKVKSKRNEKGETYQAVINN